MDSTHHTQDQQVLTVPVGSCWVGGGKGSTKSCRDSPTVPTATTMPCRHNQQQLLGLWTRSAHPAQFWGCSLCKSRGAATPQTNCGQQRDSRGKSRAGEVKAMGRTRTAAADDPAGLLGPKAAPAGQGAHRTAFLPLLCTPNPKANACMGPPCIPEGLRAFAEGGKNGMAAG